MTLLGKSGSDGGFALVEALASLAVIGMISLMLLAGATTGRRVWEGLDTREGDQEQLESAQAMLRDRLDEAFPQTLYFGDPPTIDFTGTADRVGFIANPPDVERPGPLRRYTLYLDASGNLVLASISDVEPEEARPNRRVLLRGVRSIDIAYFGQTWSDHQGQWRAAWRGQPSLPDLVRVRLAFEPSDPRRWPVLILRTRATIDTACLINTLTHRCKGRA